MTNERATQTRPGASLPYALPVARGLAFDALHVAGNRRSPHRSVWYDAFALSDERIVVSSGDIEHAGEAGSRTFGEQLRDVFADGATARDTSALLCAADEMLQRRRAVQGGSAIVGVIDRTAQTFAYVAYGQLAPYVRYHDGTVAALPAGAPEREADDDGCPTALTVVDLRGVALLLLYTKGLVHTTRTIRVGLRRLGQVLDDDRLLHCASPAAWLARRMLDERSHADVALLAVMFTAAVKGVQVGHVPRWTTSWTFEATAAASHAVRQAFLRCLDSKANGGQPADLCGAELIFGELLGNVVRHAPGRVEARVEWRALHPVLHVLDNGAGYTSRRATERLPVDEMSESGRGLFIIDACAVNFCINKRESGGTHATATLALVGFS